MGKIIKLGSVLFIVALYLLVLNLLFLIDFSQQNTNTDSISSGGLNEVVGFTDSVSVSVNRDRWYGNFEENVSSSGKDTKFYIFNLIPLPLMMNGFSLLWINLIFFSIIFLWTISILFSERGYIG
jgi:hypothetical protein